MELTGLIKLIRFTRLTGLLKFIRLIRSPELSRALQESARLRRLIEVYKIYGADKVYIGL